MYPAVPPPPGAIRRVVEIKLKPGWRYDAVARAFVESGGVCKPAGLPRGTRVVAKIPSLAFAKTRTLSRPERDLQRYAQVLLPANCSPADSLEAIRAWPCVEAATVAPEISLPEPR
jgi:hypothetical protein